MSGKKKGHQTVLYCTLPNRKHDSSSYDYTMVITVITKMFANKRVPMQCDLNPFREQEEEGSIIERSLFFLENISSHPSRHEFGFGVLPTLTARNEVPCTKYESQKLEKFQNKFGSTGCK